jgi:phosphoserine phosphatase RsbU/P
VQLDRQLDGTKYTMDDLRLLLGAASQVSVALSNARLHKESLENLRHRQDIEIGRQVQRALLPAGMPAVPGYEFAAHYEAARQVGGDYYDFVPLADGRLAVLLGDVEGKGVPAGLVMAKFGVEARVCLELEPDPAAAVARLNARMCRGGPGKFVTLAVAVLDPVAHTVTVVSAGHPSPLLLRAGGPVEEVVPDEVAGWMIGIPEGVAYESTTATIQPGDCLLVYSDGVSDAMDAGDRKFELDGIRAAAAADGTPAERLDRLVDALRRHSTDCDQTDDITAVCFRRTAE